MVFFYEILLSKILARKPFFFSSSSLHSSFRLVKLASRFPVYPTSICHSLLLPICHSLLLHYIFLSVHDPQPYVSTVEINIFTNFFSYINEDFVLERLICRSYSSLTAERHCFASRLQAQLDILNIKRLSSRGIST